MRYAGGFCSMAPALLANTAAAADFKVAVVDMQRRSTSATRASTPRTR